MALPDHNSVKIKNAFVFYEEQAQIGFFTSNVQTAIVHRIRSKTVHIITSWADANFKTDR